MGTKGRVLSGAFPATVGPPHSGSSVSRVGTAGPCQPSHLSVQRLCAPTEGISKSGCRRSTVWREGIIQLPPG